MERHSSTATAPTIAPPAPPKPIRRGLEPAWTVDDARELYQIHRWGSGFFDVNKAGNVVVRPLKTVHPEIDLYEVIQGLKERGIKTPVILAFNDLLHRRLTDLHQAFTSAIAEHGYKGKYRAVYPIKVNQQRHVVEEIQACGKNFGFGLEVGSKPELLAVMGMTTSTPDSLIICNGFKEDRYVEFVTLAAKLGRTIIPVIENIEELRLIIKQAERFGIRPKIGVRVNLNSPGAGRWRHSSGAKAKFGLSISETLEVLALLKRDNMEDCLQLLHCHLGSQIHDIRNVNAGVNELTRVYVELSKMGAGLKYLDVGGGLGVDYDGSQTNFEFSTNYSLQEYASNVVYRVMSVCDEEEIPHPTIITESGRAMVAHHSVLVFDILGSNSADRFMVPEEYSSINGNGKMGDETPRPILDLLDALKNVSERRLLECYHDALQAREEAMNLFNVGHLSLQHRSIVDQLFWATTAKIRDKCRDLDSIPEELQDLETHLGDTYFGNLSIFQSLPDIWAINQIFPVMPIHRLNEQPTRHAIIADVTCDSDGKIDRFVDLRDIKKTLEVHPIQHGDEYYLAAFLVGAYQETLGDLHNLFGDTHVVHIRLDENGKWWINHVVDGDSVRDVLNYVQYDVEKLRQEIRRECELAVRDNRLTVSESQSLSKAYEGGLAGYTYLE
ncbi:MAG: biosynthetic arginine decarboxylase [Phycisphaerales bacterium]|nr:biosynthetic arginine decarboxylase [Phycisphaerales bacterium]MCI0676942.1 biosynthetic arginine decarboxylase [Phycisphaerales bacterium]